MKFLGIPMRTWALGFAGACVLGILHPLISYEVSMIASVIMGAGLGAIDALEDSRK